MKDKVLIGIIVVLIGVIAFEGVYLFNHWNRNSENNNIDTSNENDNGNNGNENPNEEVEDYVRLVDTREEDNQVVQEYEIVLNGKRNTFLIDYELFQEDMEDYTWFGLTSNYFHIDRYSLEHNESNIANGKEYIDIETLLSADFVNSEFNVDNFVIIKGIDNKSYLGIIAKSDGVMYADSANLIILNDNLENIDYLNMFTNNQKITFNDGVNYFYNDEFDVCDEEECQIRLKIEGDRIYSFYYNLYCSENPENILEKRLYTINDNQLQYEIIDTYTNLIIEGEGC